MAGTYTKRPYTCSICGGRHGKNNCPQNPQNNPQVEEDLTMLDVAFDEIRTLVRDKDQKIVEQQREIDMLWERVQELESIEREYTTVLKIMNKARKAFTEEEALGYVVKPGGEVELRRGGDKT